jgi:hypothetical protein
MAHSYKEHLDLGFLMLRQRRMSSCLHCVDCKLKEGLRTARLSCTPCWTQGEQSAIAGIIFSDARRNGLLHAFMKTIR